MIVRQSKEHRANCSRGLVLVLLLKHLMFACSRNLIPSHIVIKSGLPASINDYQPLLILTFVTKKFESILFSEWYSPVRTVLVPQQNEFC